MNPSRDKGSRFERLLVQELAAHKSLRIPLSGAARGFKSDVTIIRDGNGEKIECKSRANGFGKLYQWLEGNDYLAIKQDRCNPLIVMTLEQFKNILGTNQGVLIRSPSDILDKKE